MERIRSETYEKSGFYSIGINSSLRPSQEGTETAKKTMEKRMRMADKFKALMIGTMIAATIAGAIPAQAKKLNVITATTDMAALAQEVGGDHINIEAIAKVYQDPHFVEAKPSFLLKLRNADLLITVGLQFEIGWLPPLITQSGTNRIQVADK